MCCKPLQIPERVSASMALLARRRGVSPACPCPYCARPPPPCFLMLVFLNGSRCVSWSRFIIYDPPPHHPLSPTVSHTLSRCLNVLLHISQPPAHLRGKTNCLLFSVYFICLMLLRVAGPSNHRHPHTGDERPAHPRKP